MMKIEPVDANKLVEKYRGTVHNIARSIVRNSPVVSLEDLEQEGLTAIITAVETYDASAGPLDAYIRTCVRNALVAEANKCCGVFTIDPRVRVQCNQIVRLRDQNLTDDEIMAKLGINNRKRFYTLITLVDAECYDVESEVAVDDGCFYGRSDVMDALEEVGLTDRELNLVRMLIEGQPKIAILQKLQIDQSVYRQLQASVELKIRAWGRAE